MCFVCRCRAWRAVANRDTDDVCILATTTLSIPFSNSAPLRVQVLWPRVLQSIEHFAQIVDFGPGGLRGIGYLTVHQLPACSVYVAAVEQYLIKSGDPADTYSDNSEVASGHPGSNGLGHKSLVRSKDDDEGLVSSSEVLAAEAYAAVATKQIETKSAHVNTQSGSLIELLDTGPGDPVHEVLARSLHQVWCEMLTAHEE